MSNSFAEPRQPSLLSLTCKFEHLLHHSFLTETQGTCFSVAKLLNINKSAKQNNKFIFTLPLLIFAAGEQIDTGFRRADYIQRNGLGGR